MNGWVGVIICDLLLVRVMRLIWVRLDFDIIRRYEDVEMEYRYLMDDSEMI